MGVPRHVKDNLGGEREFLRAERENIMTPAELIRRTPEQRATALLQDYPLILRESPGFKLALTNGIRNAVEDAMKVQAEESVWELPLAPGQYRMDEPLPGRDRRGRFYKET